MTFRGNYSKGLRYHCVLLLGITSLVAAIGCQRTSPTEEKVIGTWEFTGLDATGRVVFRRDHKVIDLFLEGDGPNARWIPTSWGKWRLEGNEIVTDQEMLVGDYSPSERQLGRVPIREFEQDKLVRGDGRADFLRVHWGVEQYSQMLALVYVIVSLIALSVCVYAIRNSSLRKGFVVLAVAAVLALVWSTSTLVAELAQTGTVIIAPASLRSLRLPTEVLRVACIVIFTIGFVNLAYRLRVSVPAKDRI